MKKQNKIFLIGPMGSGKTTIGKAIAASLGLKFVDSDHEIQERTGADISTIFEYEGEKGFREREAQAIEELTKIEHQVLSTGGGAILRSDNRKYLSGRGLVIYLNCTPEQQFERTYKDKKRPLIQTEDPLGFLKDLMKIRDPLYKEIADHIISTEGRSANAVSKDIIDLVSL
tara:strand:+ start:257 stop:772 length:516 start_codon:yes stop_codon:yes gene_type:complete